jgi:hypothetical protein
MRARPPEEPAQSRHSPAAIAFALSLVAHAALAVLVARWVAEPASTRASPFAEAPLRATLSTQAQRFVVSAGEQTVELHGGPSDSQTSDSSTSARPSAGGLPAPEQRKQGRSGAVDLKGHVIANLLGADEPVDPRMQQVIEQIYPGATRAQPEFETMPSARYPDAALNERRNVELIVLVVVLEDGSVELAQGTSDDPLFGPSIKAALAAAKAQPPIIDGRARPIWWPMSFTFEVVGGP